MALKESGEMYLETILILSKEKDMVRSIDVAEYMNFSKPSVSRAMSLLKSEGMINIEASGAIELTESGMERASGVYDRHNVLRELLVSLGVDEKTAAEDACKMEHYLSQASFEAIKNHLSQA